MAKGDIKLSPKHGLNPAIPMCFFCMKPKNEIILAGKLPNDVEAPQNVVWDRQPCEECLGYMEQGIILVSVKDDGRTHECLSCKHEWTAPVVMSEHTANLSGEATAECPRCSSHAVHSGPIVKQDRNNPHRTGGWVVVREDLIRRAVSPEDVMESMLKMRFAFVTDASWKLLGLPPPGTSIGET